MRFLLTLSSLILAIGILAGCEDEEKNMQSNAAGEKEMQAVAEEVINVSAEPVAPIPTVVETPKPEQQPADPDAVVVTVNGKNIKEAEVAEEVEKRVQAQMSRIPPGMLVPPERIQAFRDQMRLQVDDMLVDKMLINDALKEKNIEITSQQVDDEMKRFAADNGITVEEMMQQITQSGMKEEDIRDQFLMREKINALMKAEMGDLTVSEDEVKKYYDDNIQQFSQPEMVTASHILLKTQGKTDEEKAEIHKKMEDILSRAKAGEDFGSLAKEYSEDPGSKDKGGEYTFPRDQMVKPFEDAAFGLEDGQISDIIETQFGYHIIKTKEHIAAKTQSFDEVKDQITSRLNDQKMASAWQTYQKKLREDAKIEWSPAEQARREAAARPPMRAPAPTPQPAQPDQP